MAGRIAIIKYMRKNVEDSVDQMTGEVNDTRLAEDACWALEPDKIDIPDLYFDCAHFVANEHEIKTGVKPGSLSSVSNLINSLPSDYF